MSWTDAVRAWVDAGAQAPPAVALLSGVGEVVLVAAALATVGRSRRSADASPAPSLPRPEAIALFAVAFLVMHLAGGWHAVVWQDTNNDQRDVTRCLMDDACTRRGEGTSVLGLSHAVAWLDFRTLAARIGLGLDAVHVVLQILDAWSVVLVTSAAFRARGRLFAGPAAVAMLWWILTVARMDALYNSAPVPFLSSVFLLSGAAAAENPSATRVIRLALVGALMANVHAGCTVAGVSVVAVALLARGRRLRLAALAAVAFAAGTFLMAPGTWIHNGRHVLELAGDHGTAREGMDVVRLVRNAVLLLLGAWVLVRARRGDDLRSPLLDASAAIALPIVLASFGVTLFGVFRADMKYLAHAAAAEAILCAAAAAAVIERRWPEAGTAMRPWTFGRVAGRHPILLPGVLAAFTALPRPGLALTYHDLAAVTSELGRRGFRYLDAYRGLKTEGDATAFASLAVADPSFAERSRGSGPPDDERNAFLLIVPSSRVPRPLPSSWSLVRDAWPRSVVLVFAAPSVDWAHFEACVLAPDRCASSGIGLGDRVPGTCISCTPGLPEEYDAVGRVVELRLSARVHPGLQQLRMVRGGRFCGGRVTQVPGPSGVITDEGRTATWDGSDGGEVRIQWRPGTVDCPRFTFTGFPPSFLEGDAPTVLAMARAARQDE
jgi:hypothetical protein